MAYQCANVVILYSHLIVTVVRLARPGSLRSIVAESLLVKHQPRIVNRGRKRAPIPRAGDGGTEGVRRSKKGSWPAQKPLSPHFFTRFESSSGAPANSRVLPSSLAGGLSQTSDMGSIPIAR
jgi:hypothetical protein